MSKIYSRPRLKIPKFILYKRQNSRIDRTKKKLLIIVVIAIATVKFVLDAVLPIFDEICENKAISMATIISNNKATEVMKKHSYDELFEIEKDESGNITMINSNIVTINEIMSNIAIMIQDEIDNQGRENIEIALRKFYWS